MIQQDELRIGNFVYWNPHFSHSNIEAKIEVEIAALLPDKAGYISSHLEHRSEPFEDDMITKETPFASYEELEPIPITEDILKKMSKKIKYPKWIKYVHELQNWFYWNNNKKEIEIIDCL
ncbi:MAG: hypothetical protein M3004_08570 [Bacteroidota bacterium]|nr:hypothetical protein [Bacteroidota bacterium]